MMPEVQKSGAEQAVEADAVTSLTTGGYAIAYSGSEPFLPDLEDLRMDYLRVAIYDSTGNLLRTDAIEELVFEPFIVSGASYSPIEIITLDNGGYVIDYAWHYRFEFSDNLGQHIRFRDAAGASDGNIISDQTNIPAAYGGVEILTLTSGNFVNIEYSGASDELVAQIFNWPGQVGGDIDVSAAPLELDPSAPALQRADLTAAALNGGGFAVAWTDRSTLADGDNSGSAVKARFFDAAGAATTAQLLVNTSTNGDQTQASAVKLNDGNIVVVWTDTGGNGGDAGSGIKGQRFTAAGVKIGREFVVNTTTAGNQQNPFVAVLTNGAFVVAWEDRNPGAGDADGGIRGQLFSASGVKLGSEFLVNTTTAGIQFNPEVAALENGRFVVKWDGHTQIFDTSAFDLSPPVIGSMTGNSAFEYITNGYVVGTVQATDASALAYSLVNDAGGRFAINAATGRVTVADGLRIDHEQAASHLIRVRVTDASGNSSESDFTISVLNHTPENIQGDSRDNIFYGGAGVDQLNGAQGNDLLNGAAGADIMRGGFGDDRYYFDHYGDQVIELAGQGNDTVFTTLSIFLNNAMHVETLRTGDVAGTSNLMLGGNSFANTILGNAGNNRIDGGGGIDDMRGFGGNDLYFVDNAGDKVTEAAGGGLNTVVASVSYALGAGVYVATLQTIAPLASTVINLSGNELGQTIRGNAGMNVIRGGGGGDAMFAGVDSVRDIFLYGAASDSGAAQGGYDRTYQFGVGTDKIDLRPVDADAGMAGNQAFRFVAAFTAPVGSQAEGQVRLQEMGPHTMVLIDIDGDNVADMQILMIGAAGMTAGDLWL